MNNVQQFSLDSLDEKILNELIENPKIQLRKLAQKFGVSFVTIMNRIKRLEEKKIIKHYTSKIDYTQLGYDLHVLIDMRLSKGKIIDLEKRLSKFANIYAVYDTTGEFDAAIFARFKTTRSMDEFLKKIQTLEFVERTNTRIILNTLKEDQIKL